MPTNIEWTDVTDNIVVVKGGGWWCRMISPGCINCYAAKFNQSSFFGGNKLAYAGPSPEMELRRDVIDGWQRQTKPKKHFVASMTDIFGTWVEREWIFYFLDGMLASPRQTFQMLTKRPGVAASEIGAWLEARCLPELPWHMQIGTSVEDQTRADLRIPLLLSIPAKVRFLSCEPLLGPVSLERPMPGPDLDQGHGNKICQPWYIQSGIDWVICGGESGPGARPMHPDWARSLRDQCSAAGVPFLFKQWGEWVPMNEGAGSDILWHASAKNVGFFDYCDRFNESVFGQSGHANPFRQSMARVGKRTAGRLLDGVEHNEFPSPSVQVAA